MQGMLGVCSRFAQPWRSLDGATRFRLRCFGVGEGSVRLSRRVLIDAMVCGEDCSWVCVLFRKLNVQQTRRNRSSKWSTIIRQMLFSENHLQSLHNEVEKIMKLRIKS
jgi:hypothetical protein